MQYNLLTILGATATGKTAVAVQLADEFSGEIISADSRQVYRYMDIGTGKDLDEYIIDGRAIRYHIIDIINPEDEYNIFFFKKHFVEAFDKIRSADRLPIMTGGSGMYLSTILQNYTLAPVKDDTERRRELEALSHRELIKQLKEKKDKLHNITDLETKDRTIQAILIAEAESETGEDIELPVIKPLIIGIKTDRNTLKERITARLKKRLETGMIEEVEKLKEMGISVKRLNAFGLEYKFINLYLEGSLNYNDMYQKLRSAIYKFAKRQEAWFRKMEREGISINWIEEPDADKAAAIIREAGIETE